MDQSLKNKSKSIGKLSPGRPEKGEICMLKSHAKILLKALNFWKLRFNDKSGEWGQKYVDADQAFALRRAAEIGVVDGNVANDNIVDEGYHTDRDSEFDDDYSDDFVDNEHHADEGM